MPWWWHVGCGGRGLSSGKLGARKLRVGWRHACVCSLGGSRLVIGGAARVVGRTRRAFAFDAPAAIAAAPVTTGMKIERRVQVLRVACWPLELMVSAAAGATSMRQRTVMMDRMALLLWARERC